jgi:hypothetical protein
MKYMEQGNEEINCMCQYALDIQKVLTIFLEDVQYWLKINTLLRFKNITESNYQNITRDKSTTWCNHQNRTKHGSATQSNHQNCYKFHNFKLKDISTSLSHSLEIKITPWNYMGTNLFLPVPTAATNPILFLLTFRSLLFSRQTSKYISWLLN